MVPMVPCFLQGFCSLKVFCCRNAATKRCYRCSAWRDKQLDFQREDWSPGLACDWFIISLDAVLLGSCFTAGTHLILLILTDNPQMVRTGTISLVRLPFVTKGAAEIVHYRRKGRGRITSLRVTNLDGHGRSWLQVAGPSLNGGTPIPPQVKRCAAEFAVQLAQGETLKARLPSVFWDVSWMCYGCAFLSQATDGLRPRSDWTLETFLMLFSWCRLLLEVNLHTFIRQGISRDPSLIWAQMKSIWIATPVKRSFSLRTSFICEKQTKYSKYAL